ncbi:MAG: hypothetical protein R3D58_12200 [Saprospiraceae bacterium]
MHLGAITHVDPLVDKKVKFFYDRFHHWLHTSIWRVDAPPESHLSLLHRIVNRLEKQNILHPNTKTVIRLYLNNNLFRKTDPLLKENKSWVEISKKAQVQFEEIGNGAYNIDGYLNLVKDLIVEMNGENGLNDTGYFARSLSEIVSFLTCPHDLPQHIQQIEYYAKILAAEYIRVGFDADDLKGIYGVFQKMLSDKSNYENRKDKFSAQFEKLLHIYQGVNSEKFVLRIDGIKTHDRFRFVYGDVELVTFKSEYIDYSKWQEIFQKQFEKHFNVTDSIIAIVRIDYKSPAEGKRRSLALIKQALGALNSAFPNFNGSIYQSYLFRVGEENVTFNSFRDFTQIGQESEAILKDMGYTIPMPQVNSKVILDQIKMTDKIFYRALSEDYPDDAILHFWRYWEAIFPPNYEAKKIINVLAKVLSANHLEQNRRLLGQFIFDTCVTSIVNSGKHITGLSYEYCYQYDFHSNGVDDFLEKLKLSTDYPYLKKVIMQYDEMKAESEDKRMHEIYYQLLWELYEQRNSIMHKGIYCLLTIDRLQVFIRGMVSRWRQLLFQELERAPKISLELAIENLASKSQPRP